MSAPSQKVYFCVRNITLTCYFKRSRYKSKQKFEIKLKTQTNKFVLHQYKFNQ